MRKTVLMTLVIYILIGCSVGEKITTVPPDDTFFETTRFIMTKEEIEIYTHLATDHDRQEFRQEFWTKRDPTPLTEENENKEEYKKRIAFAVKWFSEGIQGRGWDTERGRLLLQLGFPDRRNFGEVDDVVQSGRSRGRLRSSKRFPMEQWVYYDQSLVLVFADTRGLGRLELVKIPSNLLSALDRAKFSLDLRDQAGLKRAFQFEVEYQKNGLIVEIPVQKVTFGEEDDKMVVNFNIRVYVYLNNTKIDETVSKKSIGFNRTDLQDMRNIRFHIPYSLTSRGRYLFDVIIEDTGTASRYRNFCKTTL